MPTLLVLASRGRSLVNFRGDLMREVARAGWRVIATAPATSDDLVERLADLGVAFEAVPLDRTGTNPLRDIGTIGSYVSLFRRIRPATVFAYTAKPVLYGGIAARLIDVPRFVAMVTGMGTMFNSESRLRATLEPMTHALYRFSLRPAEAVVFQNPDDARDFKSRGLVDDRRIRIVSGSGINLQTFPPRPLPPGPVRFLMIARLLIEKGVREYAEAAIELRRRGHDARCDLVGPLETHPRSIAAERLRAWQATGALCWHGPTEDVRPFLRDTTVYVLPSYREGTPRSTLEALATGRPIITADTPGCRETVSDGVNGFLVPPRDATSLADAMEKCILGPEILPAMAAASLRLARRRFDVTLVNRSLLEAFGVQRS